MWRPGGSHRRPARGIRPRTAAKLAFVGLGPVAEVFLRNAATGTLRLEHELTAVVELLSVWSREAVIKALDRATRFRRFKASDVRAILEDGRGVPTPVGWPAASARIARGAGPLTQRLLGTGGQRVIAASPPLAGDLVEGLRRLKLATMREQAPKVLQTAITQRWGDRTQAEVARSEERRVGKECRSRWSPYH